jgi:NAD(P)H-quinone oxidoreductase subunit 4
MLMKEMGELGHALPRVFALFTIGALASLALPGMSGFASELSVFIGMATSDIYSSPFRTATVFLSAVGVILTPIYLLSMLRQIFYNSGEKQLCDIAPTCDLEDLSLKEQGEQEAVCFGNSCVLPNEAIYDDARPREVFIAACFLLPIIGIGFYPKLAMGVYDATTVALNTQLRQSYTQISQANSQIYARFSAPKIVEPGIASVAAIVK